MQALSGSRLSLPLVLTGKKHKTENIQAQIFRNKKTISCAFFFLKSADIRRISGNTRIIAEMNTRKPQMRNRNAATFFKSFTFLLFWKKLSLQKAGNYSCFVFLRDVIWKFIIESAGFRLQKFVLPGTIIFFVRSLGTRKPFQRRVFLHFSCYNPCQLHNFLHPH